MTLEELNELRAEHELPPITEGELTANRKGWSVHEIKYIREGLNSYEFRSAKNGGIAKTIPSDNIESAAEALPQL